MLPQRAWAVGKTQTADMKKGGPKAMGRSMTSREQFISIVEPAVAELRQVVQRFRSEMRVGTDPDDPQGLWTTADLVKSFKSALRS
jgi:hypothetical protein